jgi:hemoglobin/transferrin/lactoferrin receptor protein
MAMVSKKWAGYAPERLCGWHMMCQAAATPERHRMHSRRLLVPTLALAVCAVSAEEATTVPAPAPAPDAGGPAATLPVSATRLNSAPEDQPYAFYQHGRNELDHATGRTAVEALNNTPGVFVQKTAGNQSSPYIRGLTGEQTLLLFDGVRLSNAMFRPGANQYSALIPDSSLGGIDVILGSSSTVTGSDGLTGAIDFRLAEAGRGLDQAVSPWVAGRAGYADGYRGALGVDGRVGDFAYSVDGGYAYFHDLIGGKDAEDHLFTGDNDDEIPNSGFREYHFGGRVAYLGVANNRFELAAGMTEQWDAPRADGYPENNGSGSAISRYYDPQTFSYVHARHIYGGAGAVPRIQTTVYLHLQEEEQFREDINALRYRRRQYQDEISTVGLDLQLTSFIQRHELTYGGTIYQDRTSNDFQRIRTTVDNDLDPDNAVQDQNSSTNPGSTTVPDGSVYNGAGVFLQDFWRITDQWDLLAGIRYSRYDWNFDVTADRAGYAAIGNTTIDENTDAITGSLRLGFSPVPPVYTFAGVSQGFRAPNLSNLAGIQDRGSSNLQIQGNPNLDAEKSLTYELGGRWTEERDTIALTGFYTTIDDLIQVEYTDLDFPPDGIDAGDTARLVNTDEARLWGLEFSFDYGLPVEAWLPVGARLSLFQVTNWVNGEVDAFDPATSQVTEQNLSKANRLFGQAGVRLDLAQGWWGLVRTRWSDAYDEPSLGDGTDIRHTVWQTPGEEPGAMPGYAVLDLKVGWAMPNGKYWVDLTLENLLNRSYREPGSGTDGSGINLIASAGARF